MTFKIKRLTDILKNSSFARNVIVVVSGTAGAQAITIVFAPLITRMYGPEAFGLQGTFMAVAAIMIPIAGLSYPIAIVIARNDDNAIGLARLSLITSLVMMLLIIYGLTVTSSWLFKSVGVESIEQFKYLIPIVMFFSVLCAIIEQWLIREEAFGIISRATLINASLTNLMKVSAGWLMPTGGILIAISTISIAINATLLFFGLWRINKKFSEMLTKKFHVKEMRQFKKLAYDYRDFPLYRTPQSFINAASQSLPVIILAIYFGTTAAGFYTLAKLIIGVPSFLLGKAVGDVFYPKITEAARNGQNLEKHIIKATYALFYVGLFPFGLVMIFGPWLFTQGFGSNWVMSGEYARWLALFFLFNFINKPCVAVVPVLNLQRGLLIYELLSTATKLIAMALGFFWLKSSLWAVAFFSATGSIAYVIMMIWILGHAKKRNYHAKAS